MARKFTELLAISLLIFFTAGALMASNYQFRTPVRVDPNKLPTVTSSHKVLNSRTHLMQSPGTVLDSTFYDWQANGSLNDRLALVDNGGTMNINGAEMIAYLEDQSDRAMAYYYYDGSTWTGHGVPVFTARNGFGSMSQFSDGRVAVCTHMDDGQGLRAFAAFDAFIGLYAFSYYGSLVGSAEIWPSISVNEDGSISMSGSDQNNYDVSVCKDPDEVSGFGAWHAVRDDFPDWVGNDMEWPSIHSGTNGMVGVAIPDFTGAMRMIESSDNGDTWSPMTIAPIDTAGAPTEPDSTAARTPWINCDLMYIGDEPHVVYSVGQIANDGAGGYALYDFKSEIRHWSPSTGISTITVATVQSAIQGRADYVIPADNYLSVDWPELGVAVDGNTLVCVWVSFSPDDVDPTSIPPDYSYGDVWVAVSEDNGATWSSAKNVTNPDGTNLGWDDLYPGLARWNYDNNADPGKDVYMIYQSDDLAGTAVQGTEGSSNMDYIKFTGIDISDLTGIGDGHGGPGAGVPRATALSQNFPNPFNPSTTISYQVTERSHVSIRIYDVRGRLVQTLVNGVKEAGDYSVQWNGQESNGQHVSSGIYLYTMETNHNYKSTKKMVVLK